MSKARKTAASSGEPDFWRVARDWLHHWLPKVRGSSPNTVEAYRIGLESYVRWLETTEGTQRSHIGFGHFDRARLGRWVEWMRTERGYSDRTIMLRMTTMRVFLDHAGLEHPALTALGNDAAGIRVKPPARKPVDHLGEEHTKALLTAWGTGDAKSRRNRMLLILMYDTAARIGELAALTIADVGMDKPARVTLTGKRGKSRVVPWEKGHEPTWPPTSRNSIPDRPCATATGRCSTRRGTAPSSRSPWTGSTRSSKPRRPEHAAGRARPCPNASTAT